MKSNVKQSNREAAFTIVELLTVMSIIVILIGLLVPALNKVKQYAREVKQKAQFHSIDAAIELFNSEFDGYPDSGPLGPDNQPYCGAMKLSEAMMGQDLMGFHPDSTFRSDGWNRAPGLPGSKWLYPDANSAPVAYENSLSTRKGPYLPLENANAYWLEHLYPDIKSFSQEHFVLCDVFRRVTNLVTGQKIGMPILYYEANTANTMHNVTTLDLNIYNFMDNQAILDLGLPEDQSKEHRLVDPVRFYMNTKNEKVTTASRPYKADTYILISAGNDGEYGTPDDICNFDWKYRE